MNFSEMLKMVQELKPGESTAFIAEDVPIKACVNFWLELDENGKVTHFSPHLNFYAGEDTQGDVSVHATLHDIEWVATKEEVAEFLQSFAQQSGLDQQSQVWERDESADV